MKKRDLIFNLLFIFLILNLCGCATQQYMPATPEPFRTGGIYHKVLPGETLWRISQDYNIDLDVLVNVNRIPNAAKIEKGQMIFIPGATSAKSVEPEKTYSAEFNFIWPAQGKIIAYFGERFNDRLNKGLNIQMKGEAEILSSRSGRVSFAGFLKGYGRTLIIDHGDGFSTVYANNSQVLLKAKDFVSQGMVVARSQPDARKGAVSYLHFEIRRGSKPQNPLYYLP
jgi:murein DD-endopeptidase MepM/ murein hydrolase activator NlpD